MDEPTQMEASMAPNLEELTEIAKQVIAQIEGQNWTDDPLSDQDKHLIGMAVSATAHILAERKSITDGWESRR